MNNTLKSNLVILIALVFLSCSKKEIDFSSINPELTVLVNKSLTDKIDGLLVFFDKPISKNTCAIESKYIHQKLINLESNTLVGEIRYFEKPIMEKLKEQLITLQKKIESHKSISIDKECLFSLYSIFVDARYLLDALLEAYSKDKGFISRDRNLNYAFPHYIQANELKFPGDLKTGDIMLFKTRSIPFIFATELSDNPSKFDHAGIILKENENTYLCSSNYYNGISKSDLSLFMSNIFKNYGIRFALYRNEDSKSMEKVAIETCKGIEDGKYLKYGHLFDLLPEHYSSTRIISDSAKNIISNFPQFETTIITEDRPLLKGYLKEDKHKIFFPGDIETDYRFKLISEYRNLPIIRNFSFQVLGVQNILLQSESLKFGFEFTKRFVKVKKEKLKALKEMNREISNEVDQTNYVSSIVLRQMLQNSKKEINKKFPDNISKMITRKDINNYYSTLSSEKFIW